MIVREATEGDLEAAGALLTRVYLGEGWSAESSRARLQDAATLAREGTLLIAEHEGEVVGTVILAPLGSSLRQVSRKDEAEVRLLAVAPEARGNGAGEALMKALAERAGEAGFRAVVLSTQQDMTSARRLYERLGYIRQRDRDWDGPRTRMLVYRFVLAPGVTVREATEADVPALRDLLPRVSPGLFLAGDTGLEPGRKRLLDVPWILSQTPILVAEADGTLAGLVFMLPYGTILREVGLPGEMEIRMFAVNPDVRGRGIGEALMQEYVRRARAAGGDAVVVLTAEASAPARRLYDRFGFVRVPERDGRSFEVRPPFWRAYHAVRRFVPIRPLRRGRGYLCYRLDLRA